MSRCSASRTRAPGSASSLGRTPFDSSPDANASARLAVVDASNEKVRPALYMNESVEAGTSATGARSMSMPRSWRATPVLAPCERATDALPDRPISGGDIVGGAHGIRLIGPPSWSTAIRSGRLAARRRSSVELLGQRHQRIRRRDVLAEENHPADFPAADATEQIGAWRRAFHPDHQLLADHLAQRGRAHYRHVPAETREGASGAEAAVAADPVMPALLVAHPTNTSTTATTMPMRFITVQHATPRLSTRKPLPAGRPTHPSNGSRMCV